MDRVLVAHGEGALRSLQVISLQCGSQDMKDSEEVSYDCRFEFPPLGVARHIELRSNPSPSTKVDSIAPFSVDTDNRMLLMNIFNEPQNPDPIISAIISSKQLIRHLDNTTRGARREIHWEDWGPDACLLVLNIKGHHRKWACNVYGTQMVGKWETGQPKLYTIDCSRWSRFNRVQPPKQSGDEKSGSFQSIEGDTLEPSFKEMWPGLPIVHCGPILITGCLGESDAVMMSEDNIVFVDSVSRFQMMSDHFVVYSLMSVFSGATRRSFIP